MWRIKNNNNRKKYTTANSLAQAQSHLTYKS